jgi:hypothetical protein
MVLVPHLLGAAGLGIVSVGTINYRLCALSNFSLGAGFMARITVEDCLQKVPNRFELFACSKASETAFRWGKTLDFEWQS